MGQCMGTVQSLPESHFEETNAGWSKEDCIHGNPTKSTKTLQNILTFWFVGKGCTIDKYQLTQCFMDESPNYRRVRLTKKKNGQKIALLQNERSSKTLSLKLAPYGVYTYQPNYDGQKPFEEPDGKDPIYLFAKLVPMQFQGFKWEYQRCLGDNTPWKPLCEIKARPRGYKFNCLFERVDGYGAKVAIAESLQANANQYHDYGESFPIQMCAGVDEIALLLISTALEDHRDKLNSANRGKSVANFESKNGYTPPLERTRDIRGYTQGFCS